MAEVPIEIAIDKLPAYLDIPISAVYYPYKYANIAYEKIAKRPNINMPTQRHYPFVW